MTIRLCRILLSLLAVLVACELSADPATGMPRDEVIVRYGDPKMSMVVGQREILTYDIGKIILEGGRVVSVDLSTPKSAADAAVATKGAPRNPGGGWFTDFDQAKNEAKASQRKILALFTGSTWCPACIRFEREVAHDPKFLTSAQKNYVLVKIDFPREGLPPTSKSTLLAQRYGVGGYPTLFTMNADGKGEVQVDVLAAINQGPKAPGALLAQLDAANPAKAKIRIFALILGGVAFMVWWYKRKL